MGHAAVGLASSHSYGPLLARLAVVELASMTMTPESPHPWGRPTRQHDEPVGSERSTRDGEPLNDGELIPVSASTPGHPNGQHSGGPVPASFRQATVERSTLLAQQLFNAVIDLVFLTVWAVIAAGLDAALDYLEAPPIAYIMAFFGDTLCFSVVASYIVKDAVIAFKQTWRKGGD